MKLQGVRHCFTEYTRDLSLYSAIAMISQYRKEKGVSIRKGEVFQLELVLVAYLGSSPDSA